MDNAGAVLGFGLAAVAGGASALRIESLPYLRAVRPRTSVPLVGIVKRDLPDSPVRITPYVEDAVALADAGADIIAFDATARPRPAAIADLVDAIHARGRLAMADCSSLEDARAALAANADCVGTTLSGYVGGPEPESPDFKLIADMRALTPFIIAEGRIRTPAQAAEALRRGAMSVVVGSAITRTEHATSWFRAAIEKAAVERDRRILAIDIGGTKMLAGLVRNGDVLGEIQLATDPTMGPEAWISALADATAAWRTEFEALGIAVTGFVADGKWSALNPATLSIPRDFPLVDRLRAIFAVPALAVNDAQAAAWAEFRFGAGLGEDMVFLTISTGIGGGVVLGDRLLSGLAGHYGLLRSPSADPHKPFEDEVSGHWIAAEAVRAGHGEDVPATFAAAAAGAAWAQQILAGSALKVALLCQDIQFTLDPKRIVIGGGIGLAPGYLDLVRRGLPDLTPRLRPEVVAAKFGPHAGIIGAASLAASEL